MAFPIQSQVEPTYNKPFDVRSEVANAATRNAISRKYARMEVVTLDDQVKWQLMVRPDGQAVATWGTADEHWEEAGSGGAPMDGSITDALLATDVKVGSLAGLRATWGAAAAAFTSVQAFLADLFANKVDKEAGKGLSTHDFTTDEKTKLAGIQNLSNVTNDAQVKRSELGVPGGVGTLGLDGKLTYEQLPDSVLSGNRYKGTYMFGNNRISSPDAALNNAILPAASASSAGWYFIVQDEGTLSGKIYGIGDWLVSNGAAGWNKVDAVESVVMVAGRIGNIVLTTEDVAEQATNPTRRYFTEARVLATVLTGYVKDTAYAALSATTTLLGWLKQLEFRVDKNAAAIANRDVLRISFDQFRLTAHPSFYERVSFESPKLIRNVPAIRFQLVLPADTESAKPFRTFTEVTADIAALTDVQVAAGFTVPISSLKADLTGIGLTADSTRGEATIKVNFL